MRLVPIFLVAACLAAPASALADDAAPSVITGGSPDVSVGGRSAARQGDAAGGADIGAQGSPNVLINGKPALVVGAKTRCGATVAAGSPTVFVNGKPLAARGDVALGCAKDQGDSH